MSRKCTVCAHPDRDAIDKALVDPRMPNRAISRQYSISRHALDRHKNSGHIAASVGKALARHKIAAGLDLIAEVDDLRSYALLVLSQCMQQRDHRNTLAACRETREILKLMGAFTAAAREQVEAERRRQEDAIELERGAYEPPRIREVVFLHRTEDPRVQRYDEPAGSFTVVVSRQAWGEFQSWERRCGLAPAGIPVPPRVADYGEGGNGHGEHTADDGKAARPADRPGPDAGRPDAAGKGRGETAGGHREERERLDEGGQGQKPQYHDPFFQERPPSSE